MTSVVFALLLSSALPSEAVQAQLDRGKTAIADLEYELAAEELLGVSVDKRATKAQRMEANLLAGVVHRVLGSDVEAKLHFMYVLKRDPAAKLPPNQPPKVSGFFELVREEAIALNQSAAWNARQRDEERITSDPPKEIAPAEKKTTGLTQARPTQTAAQQTLSPIETSPAFSPLVIGGLSTIGVGAAVAVFAVGAATLSEVVFVTPSLSSELRNASKWTSLAAWSSVVVGGTIIVAGAVAAAAGALE